MDKVKSLDKLLSHQNLPNLTDLNLNRMLLRSIMKCRKLKFLNISENYLNPACFHVLRDVFLRANTIKYFKFYLASSDRLFNEMFLEL